MYYNKNICKLLYEVMKSNVHTCPKIIYINYTAQKIYFVNPPHHVKTEVRQKI
jgi:hypothetical protein